MVRRVCQRLIATIVIENKDASREPGAVREVAATSRLRFDTNLTDFHEFSPSEILIRGLVFRSTAFTGRKLVWHHRAKKPET